MSKLVLSSFFVFVLLLFVVFTASFQYITMASKDNKGSVDNVTRNAMTVAVNWGTARVEEKITIHPTMAEEAVLRQYAETSEFGDGDRSVGIYAVAEDPAMLAVELYSQFDTPMQHTVNNFTRKQEVTDAMVRNRNVVIYEAKTVQKPYATQMAGSH